MTDQTLPMIDADTPVGGDTPIDEAALVDVVQHVWATLLDSSAAPADISAFDGTTATISIVGVWNATLTMTMDDDAVASCAAQLFGLDADELDDELRADAIGEIANVVGGNLKSLVGTDPPPTLSLPIVSDTVPDVVGATTTVEAGFDADGHHVLWKIHDPARPRMRRR